MTASLHSTGVRIRDPGLSLDALQRLTALAERRGYSSVWLPENMGRDAISEQLLLAASTQRIEIATGIVPVFGRCPTLTASAVATAAAVAPGRITLGLGIGHRSALTAGHGITFSQPIARTREFAQIARKLLREGEVHYEGEVYRIEHYALSTRPAQTVPVYIAALRPGMLRVAGAVADGVLLNWASLGSLGDAIAQVRAGAVAAGRSPDEVRIASYLRTCVSDDPTRVEHMTRSQIAQYCSMQYYQRYFESIGFAQEAKSIAQAWASGDAAAAAAAVTPTMIRSMTIYGSAAQCCEQLSAYRDAGLDLPIIAPFPIGEPVEETFVRTIEGCAGN